MTVEMDETFALAVRDQLVEEVKKSAHSGLRARAVRPWLAGAGAVVALAAAGSGIAYATGVFTEPGSNVVTSLAPPVSTTGVGTENINLGPAPPRANAIQLGFTCLTAGSFQFADGAGVDCSAADATAGTRVLYTLAITPGQDSTLITASSGARWQLTATYSNATLSAWATNASGQTYGDINVNGTPDLVAVTASNGHGGYVYANKLNGPQPATPTQAAETESGPRTLTVYDSDGRTPVGTFTTSAASPTTETSTATSAESSNTH